MEQGGHILGIDPGKTGGMVLLSSSGSIAEKFVFAQNDEGDLDLNDMARKFAVMAGDISFAVLEKPNGTVYSGGHSRGQSISTMFSFGKTCGQIEGMLAAFRIPYILVHPRTWTSVLHKNIPGDSSKVKSRELVRIIWPCASFLATKRSKKPHDGLIDAALLAWYGKFNR